MGFLFQIFLIILLLTLTWKIGKNIDEKIKMQNEMIEIMLNFTKKDNDKVDTIDFGTDNDFKIIDESIKENIEKIKNEDKFGGNV